MSFQSNLIPVICPSCNHVHTKRCNIKIKCPECDHIHDDKCKHIVETLNTGTYPETIWEPHNVYRTELYDTVEKITKTRTVMKLKDVPKTRSAIRFINVNHPRQITLNLSVPCSRKIDDTHTEYYNEYKIEHRTVDNWVNEVERYDESYTVNEMVPTVEKYVEEIPCVKERQVLDHVDYIEKIITKNNPRINVYCNCGRVYESSCHCTVPTNKLCGCEMDSMYDIEYPQHNKSTYILPTWNNNHMCDSNYKRILGIVAIISSIIMTIGFILLFTVKNFDDTYNYYYTILIVVPFAIIIICSYFYCCYRRNG
jgi:hypothetical protein